MAGAFLATPATADQNDPRLPALFKALASATDPAAAELIELEIWNRWMIVDDLEASAVFAAGVERMAMGDYAGALKAFDAVVEKVPGFAEGWNKRATVLYMLGEYDRSIEDVKRTLALEPRHFGALSGLGLIQGARGNDEAALAAFERALAIHPNMPGVKHNVELLRERLHGQPI